MTTSRPPDLPAVDIPVGEGRVVVAGGREVAVFRLRDGSLRALDARCPHQGGPLADGLCDQATVMCPLHSRSFDFATGVEKSGDYAVGVWLVDVDEHGMVQVRDRVG